MHPILIDFGFFSIKTYGFFIAAAFLAGIALAVREARRQGVDSQIILDMSFYMIIGAIVGSRLFYVLTNFTYYLTHPLDLFKVWQGGLTFYGGFILAISVCLYMIHRYRMGIWKTFDLFAPSLALGVMLGRLGCFSAGCCHGRPCDLPWAITFTHPESLALLHVPLHPVQLYASAGALITFVVLYCMRNRKTFDGQLALLWMLLYSASRSVEELFRGDVREDLLLGYPSARIIALGMLVGVAALYPVVRRRNRRTG
jgi:phosphatidylglycerol---prolipoprotein diacylglyceryl transferase